MGQRETASIAITNRTAGHASDPSEGVTRRRFLKTGIDAAASAIVVTGSAMAETRDPGQLADARALLAESLTIDMHSHAGLTSDSWGPIVPLARPMREAGMKAIALAFSSDRPLQSTRDGRIAITREPEPGELRDYSRGMFERLRLLIKEQALAVVTSAAELEAARTGAPGIIVTVEGGDFLEGSVARLDEAYADQVGFAFVPGCSTKTTGLICFEGGGDRTAAIVLHGGHSNVRILVPSRRG